MNIVYLLVPLIWLDGLAAGSDPWRGYLTWILGLSGVVVIAGVYRCGMKQPSPVHPGVLALAAGGWFAAASLPTFLTLGAMPLVACAVVALATIVLVRLPVFGQAPERRFEIRVLKRVWPVYASYLLLVLLWPVPDHLTTWRGGLGSLELADESSIARLLQLIEQFSAFTLLGYMVAESHRRKTTQPQSIARTCAWCGMAALVLEVLRGFHPNHVASASQGVLLLTGSACGAWIYWRQLLRVRQLHRQSSFRPLEEGHGAVH
jgi:hypothetical protein